MTNYCRQRDPDGYCWPCSPRFAHLDRKADRFESLAKFGGCEVCCPECPYLGRVYDRKNLIRSEPLAAARLHYVKLHDMAADWLKAWGEPRPKLHPWAFDPQPGFWRDDKWAYRPRFKPTNTNWHEIKKRFDLRSEWAQVYGQPLEETGKAWKAVCPFHSGDSMRLYEDHYHCFGCQRHGDVIDVLKAGGKLDAVLRGEL